MPYRYKLRRRWRSKMRQRRAGSSSRPASFSKIPGYAQGTRKLGSSVVRSTRREADTSRFWVRFWIAFVFLGLPVVLAGFWFYTNVIKTMPDIEQIENADFSQTTVITDRHGTQLYKLFEENREYISYDEISDSFVNAIVATEDQRFWDNPGVDRKGTIRALITDVRYGKTHGGSTITQQVIKNILLTPEKNITRKLKEIILAVKLGKYVRNDIADKYENLSGKELDRKVKEKVLELYANYIFLGNNSYGLEIASKTYFGVSAKDLTVLQGAVLAGIPQAPSTYDPYTRSDLLMGEVLIAEQGFDFESDEEQTLEVSDSLRNTVMGRFKDKIDGASLGSKKNDEELKLFLKSLLGGEMIVGGKTYEVAYQVGRKDAVLARMYEEEYITESQLKKALIDGLDYQFSRSKIEIKAPHFVFWVIKELEQKYDQEVLRTGGLKIKTTLDYDIQKLAQASINENLSHLRANQAYNSAMLYTDSHSGDVLAYIGSKDYNNEDIDGQVDMIQANRQPGSTIKPFVYALGLTNNKMTLDSPLYDIETKFGDNTPQNADGSFWGLTSVKKALAGSRNIPAIKMFLSVGGEPVVKNYLEKLGVSGLIMDRDHYGYALSLGAAEMPMMELANAYAHLSAMGKPAEIDPILEIRGADDSILYKKEPTLQEQVVPAGVAYLMWNILSDKVNFPESWREQFTAPGGINFATKSGTTNVVKGETKLPRDGRLATYTPSKVLLMRAGNSDGSPLKRDAYGGWVNSPVWKTFVGKLAAQQYIRNETMEEREVKQANISEVSGKLATANTPLVFIKKSLGYIHSLPTEYDEHISALSMDTLCYGAPTDLTPPEALGTARYVKPETIMPNNYDQEDVMKWRRSGGASTYSKLSGKYVTVDGIGKACEDRSAIAELGEISLDLMQPTAGQNVTRSFTLWHQTTSPFTITEMKVSLGDVELKTFTYNQEESVIDIAEIAIPESIQDGEYVLKAVIRDEKGYSDSKSVKITVSKSSSDKQPPYLIKDKINITPLSSGGYGVVLLFGDDASSIKEGSLTMGGSPVHSFQGNIANFTLKSIGTIDYSVTDANGNVGVGKVILESPGADQQAPAPEPEPAPVGEEPVVPPVEEPAPEPVAPPPAPVEEEVQAEAPALQENQPVEPAPVEPAPEPAPEEEVVAPVPDPAPVPVEPPADTLTRDEVQDAVNKMFPNPG